MIEDGYAQWYADRLWGLLPAVYRTLDAGPAPGAPGPLRELVNRIGNQAAVVRRSIDRLGENQSIETCDDWAIPYIGDLVATRLVSCLNAAAQRIDVAKTIYYRRRAGTLGVLEELAADIALRDARVVEFFRRMGRTRHQFDPPLGYAIENPIDGPVGFTDNSLEIAEGLTGFYSGTPAGGFADLRNAYAASNTGTAFDEYAYTADLRQGSQSLGWYNIRHLGVFLWWLQAFPISAATPVSSGTAQPCFTFDPTGRDAPLFAPSQRLADSGSNMWGEDWVSPSEWELPVEIRETLWRTVPEQLYGTAFAFWVGLMAGGSSAPVPPSTVSIHPREGRFSFPGGAPAGTLTTSYYFGLLSRIGAGGYNHAILSPLEAPPAAMPVSGGLGLDAALAGVAADVTIEIADSLTYAGPTQSLTVPEGCMVVLQGASGQRPVLRWTGAKPAEWVIAGQAGEGGSQTVLVLQGMLLQGADVVLQGSFDAVYLRLMTVDPGTSGMPSSWFGTAGLPAPPSPSALPATRYAAVDRRSQSSARVQPPARSTPVPLPDPPTPAPPPRRPEVPLLQTTESLPCRPGSVIWRPLPALPLLQKSLSSSSHSLRHKRRQQLLHRCIQQRCGEVPQLHSVRNNVLLHIQRRSCLSILYQLRACHLDCVGKRVKPRRIHNLYLGERPPHHIHRKRDFSRLRKCIQVCHVQLHPRSRNSKRQGNVPQIGLVI